MSRAKRAKETGILKKLLFILILLIMIIGVVLGFQSNIETTIASIIGTELIDYNSSDVVEAAFTDSGTRYLPIILGSTKDTVSKTYIENEFKNAGLTVSSVSSNTIATGTKVETSNGTYTVLIYGDTNGDGNVNVLDASAIMKHVLRNF